MGSFSKDGSDGSEGSEGKEGTDKVLAPFPESPYLVEANNCLDIQNKPEIYRSNPLSVLTF